MHRSRFTDIVIDCQTKDLAASSRFWAGAMGRAIKSGEHPETENYVALETRPDELGILLQRVDHPSRVHLDIESDDIEAEVARLEALGARRVEKIQTWWVMEAPSGHRFCVVRPQRGDEMPGANRW